MNQKQKDLLAARWLQKANRRQVECSVPCKKKSKPVGYKMQNTFEKNLRGVPGGNLSRGITAATIKMIAAPTTGTRIRKEGIGMLASARNANTTQGSYVEIIWS